MEILVHPINFVDKKMRGILMVPPVRKPKENILVIEIKEDDLHDKETRASYLKKALLEKQKAVN